MVSEQAAELAPSSLMTPSTDSPIFIVGLGRSGTTLLSRMLDAHSEIAIFPETWWSAVLDRLGCGAEFSNPWQTSLFFNEIWQNLKSYPDPAARVVAREASKHPRYMGPTAWLLEELGHAYANERRARIWGEKTPAHALYLTQIKGLFPRARVLFMVRDPRDVLVSYDDRWNEGRRSTEYLVSTAALLKYYLFHLFHQPEFPREQVCWVKYESLTAQPSEELQRICTFLGVDFEPTMLNFYRRHANVVRDTPDGRHHSLLSRPATTDHVGRYKKTLSPSQIALVERVVGQELEALGYPHSRSSTVSLTAGDERSFEKAEDYYQQMISGEIRKRSRRKGKLKLRVYQTFGRALNLIPSLRVATTDSDWQCLAEETESADDAEPLPRG